ncbi:MAG: hypothetical protein WCS99_09230 [Limisphaerales bacterium]
MVVGHWSFAQSNLPPATVSFLDGSFLRGEVELLNGETLKWRHPNARLPIEFSTTNLNLIRLPARVMDLPANGGPVCRVKLAGGDEFEARLLSLDGDGFEVETWFAGRLRGARAGLASLAFYGSSQSALYDGPRVADEWRISTGSGALNRVGVELIGADHPAFRQVAPPAPLAEIKMEPAPQERVVRLKAEIAALNDKVAPDVKLTLEKRLKEAEDLAAKAPEKAAAAANIMRMVGAAQKAATVREFLASNLVRSAADAGQTSSRILEAWFAEFDDAAGLVKGGAKETSFRTRIKSEAALLGYRLLRTLGPGVGEAEALVLDRMRARAADDVGVVDVAVRAVVEAQAQALAGARAKVLGALGLNNLNLAAGAEPFLAGRAAANSGPGPAAAWTFRDGAYFSTGVGTLGRECLLPTRARIEFDLAWKGQPYFRFSFFTRSTDHFDFNDGWQFYTSSSGHMYSMRRPGMGASSSSGARVPQLLTKNSVRLTFLVNSETETTVLLADGEKIHEWKGMGSPGNGTGIVFYNYNVSSRVRVSAISIAPWDGRERDAAIPDTEPGKAVEAPPPDSAVVEFVNRDRAGGTLHGIRDGRLTFSPAGTRMDIPLLRAAVITFPADAAPEPPKRGGVQITLHRGERLTLALEKWEAGEIIAVSRILGRLKLSPESVRMLRFNLSAPRGSADEWSGP